MVSGLGDNVIYLEFYYHCAGSALASNFDNMFWNGIVLQMSQSEPTVQNAVIALSYLIKTEPGNLKHARSVSKIDIRRTALLHYNKAVRCLVDQISKPSYNIEVGLVTCLLFICIDFLRGDYLAAFAHFQSGLKIIAEGQHLQSALPSPSTSVQVKRRAEGLRPLASNLVPIFIRAVGTGLLFGAPIDLLVARICPRPQNLQGQSFTSILEAEHAIYDLRNATIQWILMATRKITSGTQPTAEEMMDQAHLLRCHDSWFQALQALERDRALSDRDKVSASSLRVSHYSTYIALTSALDIYQTTFDSHLSSFKALNHDAKVVLDSMNLPTPSQSASQDSPPNIQYVSCDNERSTSPSSHSKGVAAHFTFEISLISPLVRKIKVSSQNFKSYQCFRLISSAKFHARSYYFLPFLHHQNTS